MKFIPTKFSDAFLIEPKVFKDNRGFFLESFSKAWLDENGIDINFVQDNHSYSLEKGVLRGLHFQLPPKVQTKLVRVTKGSVFDVIVDFRDGSPTYGQWEGFELTAENFRMLLIPKGFAHAFCTLVPKTEFMYKVDEYYSPQHDSGIIWNDNELGINWPIKNPILSDKDKKLGSFKEFKSPFKYEKL